MSRVYVDVAAGRLAQEPETPRSPIVGGDPTRSKSFDRHLEQARRLAAAPGDARPETPSGTARARPAENPAKNDPGRSTSDDSVAARNPAKSPTSQSAADDSQRAGSGNDLPSAGDRRAVDNDSDQDSDAELADGAAATAAQGAGIQAGNASPQVPGVEAAGVVDSTGVAANLASALAAAVTQGGLDGASTLNSASPGAQLARPAAALPTGLDAAAQTPQAEDVRIAEGSAPDEFRQEHPAATSAADPSLGISPGVSASSADRPKDANAQAALPAEAQPSARRTPRTESPPVATAPGESQASPEEPQAATTEVNDPRQTAARPADTATAQADLLAAGDKPEIAAGDDPRDPSRSGKVADLGASRIASAQASGAAGQRGEEAAGTEAADRARFVQRVARAFESAADRGGHVRLRLHPPDLGSLRLDLTVRNGHLSARLETDTESARNMLLESLPALKERLAGHRIQVERFDIEWRGQAQGGLPQRSGDPDRWHPPFSGRAGRDSAVAPAGPGSDAGSGAARRLNPGTSFDVVI